MILISESLHAASVKKVNEVGAYDEQKHMELYGEALMASASVGSLISEAISAGDKYCMTNDGTKPDVQLFMEAITGDNGVLAKIWDAIVKAWNGFVNWFESIRKKVLGQTSEQMKKLRTELMDIIESDIVKNIDKYTVGENETLEVSAPKIPNNPLTDIKTLFKPTTYEDFKIGSTTFKGLFGDIKAAAETPGKVAGFEEAVKTLDDMKVGYGKNDQEGRAAALWKAVSEADTSDFFKGINVKDAKTVNDLKDTVIKNYYTENKMIEKLKGTQIKDLIKEFAAAFGTTFGEIDAEMKKAMDEGSATFKKMRDDIAEIANDFKKSSSSYEAKNKDSEDSEKKSLGTELVKMSQDVGKMSAWFTALTIDGYSFADKFLWKSMDESKAAFAVIKSAMSKCKKKI